MPIPSPGRTLIMGILNVTPDSFSDGGRFADVGPAVEAGLRMVDEGADIIDIGGESTRPGAQRVTPEEELRRVEPVVRALADHGVPVSVDTMRASTARAALEAGAAMVNDVSGGRADPAMLPLCAEAGVPVCLMHWQRPDAAFASAEGAADHGGDVVSHVLASLQELAHRAEQAGVRSGNIVVDPGIGFAKTAADNWRLLQATEQIAGLGYPVLYGVSRKRFLTALRPGDDGLPGAPSTADDATAAVSALLAQAGAWAVRVHNVPPNRAAVDVAACLAAGCGPDVPQGWRAHRG